jgi:hypothetical protein
MTLTPRTNRSLKGRRLSLIVLVLAIFFAVSAPTPASAQVIDISPTANALLATIGGLITALQAALTAVIAYLQAAMIAVMNFLMQYGFSSVASAVNAQSIIQGKVQELTANFHAQTAMYVPQVSFAAQRQADSLLSTQSVVCQRYMIEQAKLRLEQDMVTSAASWIFSNDCKGVNADCSSAARQKEVFTDRCQLGFVSQVQYGSNAAGCKAAPDPSYVDRDHDVVALIYTPQMVFAAPCVLPDGYPSFSGAQGNQACQAGTAASAVYNANPLLSQLAWVAAFKYCQGLADELDTPDYSTSGNAPTDKAIRSMNADTKATAMRMGGAMQTCIKLLIERTAFPTGMGTNEIAVGGGQNGETMHQDQVNVCNGFLSNTNPSNSEVGGGTTGQQTFPANGQGANGSNPGINMGSDAVLQQCNQYGLSKLYQKYLEMHPCADQGHVLSHSGRTSVQEDEHYSDVTCPEFSTSWDQFLLGEQSELQTAINNSMQMMAIKAGAQALRTPK